MSEPIYLKHTLSTDGLKQGLLEGVAYSGSVIPQYMWYKNFIVDVATLKVAKKKTPVLRDHNPAQVAGSGEVSLAENQVLIKGALSKKSLHGQEIIALAEDEIEWEMSLGVYEGQVEEVENVTVNGVHLAHGFVLRNGLIREVSVVVLGADKDTEAKIMSQYNSKGEKYSMKITDVQYANLACACGGTKDSTPEDLEAKVKATKMESEADKAKVEDLTKQIEDLKSQVAAKEAEIAKIKGASEESERETQIQATVKEKGLTFSEDKIKDAAKTKEKTEMFLSLIADMKPAPKIPANLGGKVTVDEATVKAKDETEAVRLKAEAMVKDGSAKNFMEAILKLEEK